MKTTSKKHAKASDSRPNEPALTADAGSDELRDRYDFDYSKAKPNRFAERFQQGAVAVVLEPDVANVFNSSEAVNNFLRSAISAMPHSRSVKKHRAS
jgi:hypothetical protein